jgi:hypothetical protein
MKPVNWSTEKNIRLKAERGVSFEEVVSAMSNGGLLVVLGSVLNCQIGDMPNEMDVK